MVNIITREVSGKEYFYISYSYRKEDKTLHKEKYIGSKLPSEEKLEHIKEEFFYEIIEERWLPIVNQIMVKYREEFNSFPHSIQVKDLKNFGVRFTHNTNKIEGSSLSYRDVSSIIEHDFSPKNKPASDIIEAKSHMSVYEEMIECTQEVTLDLLLQWHKKLFQLTKQDIAGNIRDYRVEISGSKHIPPAGGVLLENLLKDLFFWFAKNVSRLHLVVLACIMHYEFVSIHPFGDGNGRISRVLMNYILFKNKYPMFDIDFNTRQGYFNALERANINNDKMIFISWFFKNYIKANNDYLL